MKSVRELGYLIIFVTITVNCVPSVHSDCEMDCTNLQVQQLYHSIANSAKEYSRVNFGIFIFINIGHNSFLWLLSFCRFRNWREIRYKRLQNLCQSLQGRTGKTRSKCLEWTYLIGNERRIFFFFHGKTVLCTLNATNKNFYFF